MQRRLLEGEGQRGADAGEPSTPTTTGRPAAGTCRTTTTGQAPYAASWTAVEPAASPSNPPTPCAPTTAMTAPSDSSIRIADAGPAASLDRTSIRGATCRATATPWSSRRRPASRAASIASASADATGYGQCHVWQTCNGNRRARASSAAQHSASSLSGEPS